jgi:hypothetical protein
VAAAARYGTEGAHFCLDFHLVSSLRLGSIFDVTFSCQLSAFTDGWWHGTNKASSLMNHGQGTFPLSQLPQSFSILPEHLVLSDEINFLVL